MVMSADLGRVVSARDNREEVSFMAQVEQASRGFERTRDDSKDHGHSEHSGKDRREDGGEDGRDW